ncbi:MAG: ATPase [Dehalogenimonas sp.]
MKEKLGQMDVFVSWSGGKDCTLSCYRAINAGHNVRTLASMVTTEMGRLYPHHLMPEILEAQAKAMDIPLRIQWTSSAQYTESYIKMLKDFRRDGITAGVFGDVSLGNPDAKDHLTWIKQVCQAADMEIILPLWDENRVSILSDLIESGFKALIIASDDNKLGNNWIGKIMDWEMLRDLQNLHSNSHNGEVGCYHTLTIDGPLFKNRLDIRKSNLVFREYGLFDGKPTRCPFWYLDIENCALAEKMEMATIL